MVIKTQYPARTPGLSWPTITRQIHDPISMHTDQISSYCNMYIAILSQSISKPTRIDLRRASLSYIIKIFLGGGMPPHPPGGRASHIIQLSWPDHSVGGPIGDLKCQISPTPCERKCCSDTRPSSYAEGLDMRLVLNACMLLPSHGNCIHEHD